MKIKDAEALLQAVRRARDALDASPRTRSKENSRLRKILFAPDVTAVVEARYPPREAAKP